MERIALKKNGGIRNIYFLEEAHEHQPWLRAEIANGQHQCLINIRDQCLIRDWRRSFRMPLLSRNRSFRMPLLSRNLLSHDAFVGETFAQFGRWRLECCFSDVAPILWVPSESVSFAGRCELDAFRHWWILGRHLEWKGLDWSCASSWRIKHVRAGCQSANDLAPGRIAGR